MTSFERTYNVRVMRSIKRIIDLGRSEPLHPEPEMLMAYDYKRSQAKWTALWLSLVFGLCFIASCSHAYAYTDHEAIQTLIGEASNQGYIGMVAVGEVIRQRGSLKGFYGFKNVQQRRISTAESRLALKAWIASKHTNLTHHADHFENIHAFGCPYWVKDCVKTFTYRDHVFYKEVI